MSNIHYVFDNTENILTKKNNKNKKTSERGWVLASVDRVERQLVAVTSPANFAESPRWVMTMFII